MIIELLFLSCEKKKRMILYASSLLERRQGESLVNLAVMILYTPLHDTMTELNVVAPSEVATASLLCSFSSLYSKDIQSNMGELILAFCCFLFHVEQVGCKMVNR